MVDEVLNETESKMKKAIEVLHKEMVGIRTSRASPALVERLSVDYYGAPTLLNQLANISAPEPRLLVIQPWDKSAMAAIEKAILKSELGITPNNDGKVIRLVMPQLTAERRKELAKLVHKKVEEGKVAVRNVRRDALEELKEFEKEGEISEDELKRAQERLQKLTDRYVEQAEEVGVHKTKELMEV